MSPLASLKAAISAALIADTTLTGLLGGAKVHDETPRGEATPYIAFGDAITRDNGTVTDLGHISELTLVVWSRQGGTREALFIADRAVQLLDDAMLTLTGHRLINCRVLSTDARRDAGKELTRVLLRLRAVTEAL